jgi:hypothetical protein
LCFIGSFTKEGNDIFHQLMFQPQSPPSIQPTFDTLLLSAVISVSIPYEKQDKIIQMHLPAPEIFLHQIASRSKHHRVSTSAGKSLIPNSEYPKIIRTIIERKPTSGGVKM